MEEKNKENSSSIPYYTLSIAAQLSDVPPHSIRQYIDKGLLIPFVTETHRHLFSEIDIVRLKCIKKQLHEEGLNVAGIRKMQALIPCWAIKKCPEDEKLNCGAYLSTNIPCWDASNKGESCKNTDCKDCEVYKLPDTWCDLKDFLKVIIN